MTPVFGGNFAGGVEESGRQRERGAAKAGFGPLSQLHAIGDGAPWIADQVDQHFGTQGNYRVDFFHRGADLAEASPVCGADDPPAWLDPQKDRLKANQSALVRAALAPFIEADSDAPVAACDRYRRNCLDQLDDQGALQQGLPIGSGEIESAHRHLIQKRLKLPGAWWSSAPLETLLALRLTRANQEWEAYWQGLEKPAAGTGQTAVASL